MENFSQWWDVNHVEYEKIGVNRIVAKTIWDAACDTFQYVFIEQVKKELK